MDSFLASYENIRLISQSHDLSPADFSVVGTRKDIYANLQKIERNSFLKSTFLRLKHAIAGQEAHCEDLSKLIKESQHRLGEAPREVYIDDGIQSYTEVFIQVQRFNQALNRWKGHKKGCLFADLGLSSSIEPSVCRELAPIIVKTNEISITKLSDLSDGQEPFVVAKKRLWSYKLYYYDEKGSRLNHAADAVAIFRSTQKERFLSFIGRLTGLTSFDKYHYFSKREDKTTKIYAQDAPISTQNESTSYWIGHATCLLNVTAKCMDGVNIKVNIITDPVESDLNFLLYPRMTHPGRLLENCPAPQIYLLSHNHLDHYSSQTIKKLLNFQPVMIVPEGDLNKFKKLGFIHVYELTWWETVTIPVEQKGKRAIVKITSVPANHWSGQGACDGHHAAFLGYVIHQDDGDIYFAGDTARLRDDHIETLRTRFNICTMFQPGGPDEVRKNMKGTHQSSADGLWMHFHLVARNLYERGGYRAKSKQNFIKDVKKLRTIYMHTKAYKLGNLHYDDTDQSIRRVKDALSSSGSSKELRDYEKDIVEQLLAIGNQLIFADNSKLEASEICEILEAGVLMPKIGSRTVLAKAIEFEGV